MKLPFNIPARWYKPIIHLVFWVIAVFVMYKQFALSGMETFLVDLVYTFLFMTPVVLITYLNFGFLLPKYFSKKRYGIWLLGNGIGVGIGYLLHFFIFDVLSDWLLSGFYMISFSDEIKLINYFLIFLVISTLLWLSQAWFQWQVSQQKMLQLKQENTALQLDLLRYQIQPHFLFNTLSSLYSLAEKGDPGTGKSIIRLSELLRYFIYENQADFLPWEKEWEVLQNYVNLQKLRLPKDFDIKIEAKEISEGKRIASGVWMVFLENAFKHGLKARTQKSYIHLNLSGEANSLRFEISNSKGKADQLFTDQKGIGLENVKRRLELLYRDRFQLKIDEQPAYFKVTLITPTES